MSVSEVSCGICQTILIVRKKELWFSTSLFKIIVWNTATFSYCQVNILNIQFLLLTRPYSTSSLWLLFPSFLGLTSIIVFLSDKGYSFVMVSGYQIWHLQLQTQLEQHAQLTHTNINSKEKFFTWYFLCDSSHKLPSIINRIQNILETMFFTELTTLKFLVL